MSIDHIHTVFHVSLFCKYVGDPSHMLSTKELKLTSASIMYEERTVKILDKKRKHSKTSGFPWLSSSKGIKKSKRLLGKLRRI